MPFTGGNDRFQNRDGAISPPQLARSALATEEVAELQLLLLQFARFASQAIAHCRCTVRISTGPETLHTVLAPDGSDNPPREYAVDTQIAEWVMRTHASLLVPNVEADTRFQVVGQRVSGSAICVPIAAEGTLYGTLNGWHPHPDTFNHRSLQSLRTYASGMARVIARSGGRMREQDDSRRAPLLLALTRDLAIPNDPRRTLDAVMPLLLEAILCAASVLIVAGGEGDQPETHLYAHPVAAVPGQRLRTWAEDTYAEEGERVACGSNRRSRTYLAVEMHMRAVPLHAGEMFLGTVYFFRPAPFDADTYSVLEECGHAIGVAVYNRRLYQTLAREERFEAVFAQATDGLLLLDESGTIALDANEAFHQLLHIPPETVTFPVPLAVLEQHWLDALSEAGEANESVTGHWLIHPNETRERSLEVTESPVRVGDALHRLRAFHDMSETCRTDRARVEFMSLVSHELRNPITAIHGYLTMLAEEGAGPLTPFQRECVQSARFGVRHLWRLVNDITDLLQADLGRLMLNREPISVKHVVAEAVDALQPLLIPKQLHVAVDATGPIPPTVADPIRVQQIVINLLKNAIKFSPRNALITVTLGVVADAVQVSVTDAGPGISPEDAERIFQRHEKGPQPAQQDTSGLGLGLAVVRQLVSSHGGRVWVESTLGEGSAFTFTLPLTTHP